MDTWILWKYHQLLYSRDQYFLPRFLPLLLIYLASFLSTLFYSLLYLSQYIFITFLHLNLDHILIHNLYIYSFILVLSLIPTIYTSYELVCMLCVRCAIVSDSRKPLKIWLYFFYRNSNWVFVQLTLFFFFFLFFLIYFGVFCFC